MRLPAYREQAQAVARSRSYCWSTTTIPVLR